ncbi:DUF6689 family protein [Aliiglaciecola lipolytica]|uniref:Cohesin domain-containing protein n=1 Tax=Aliiglaciecola lipolytica E3 TaxID=1127673 RepID=K6YY32_9ALTE|nr:DUF6689 family protein [Aliiglaciecola lipolytica]GAC16145.1 hypothetical protein GLIP_3533 [Aliiglaciecola lipolytica E3]
MKISHIYWAAMVWVMVCFSLSSVAQVVTPVSTTVSGDTLKAKLQVGVQIEVDLTLEFEDSIGLSADNIDISATLVNVNDLNILNRLPANDVSIFSTFPVVVTISPKTDKGFGFEGLASVEIYTKAISYQSSMPARLFTSHDGGDFEDITSMVSAGSIRARGNTGRFSEFMILLDERDDSEILSDKFAQLEDVLDNNQSNINSLLLSSLQTSIANLDNALFMQNYSSALSIVESLILTVEQASNTGMSNVWRSSGDLVNIQGELLTHLIALRYSLRVI